MVELNRTKFLHGISWRDNHQLLDITSTPEKLEAFVKKMKDPSTGIPVRDRSSLFSPDQPKCCTGEDAINWLIKSKLGSTRPEAAQFFSYLLDHAIITVVSSNSPEPFKDGPSLYHIEKRLYLFDGPPLQQIFWRYGLFINIADAFVRVAREDVGKEYCFEIVTPSKLYQFVAATFDDLRGWIASLDSIVKENLGVGNQIIEAIDAVIEQKESELCDDLVAELNHTDVHQRLILVGTGTPPPASPVGHRGTMGAQLARDPSASDYLHLSRSPDADDGTAPLPARHALARHAAGNRSFEALPRSSPRHATRQSPLPIPRPLQ